MTFKKSAKAAIGLCAAFAFGATVQAADKDVFKDPSPQEAPAIYKISDADTNIYVMGTFHLLPGGLDWQTDLMRDIMAKTKVTITEADTSSPSAQAEIQALVPELGLNPYGTTLSSIMGPERSAAFNEAAAKLGVPNGAFEAMRPWLASLSLAQIAYQRAGLSVAAGVEANLLAIANQEGDRIDHLESTSYQIRALAGMDEEELLAGFDSSDFDVDELKNQLTSGVAAWAAGEVALMDQIMIADMRTDAPATYETILATRNRNWVVKIADFLNGEDDIFIAVGSGHLYGSDNVISLLVARGIKVERIQ